MGAIQRRRDGLRARWATPAGRIGCVAAVVAAVVGTGFVAAQPAKAATGLVAAYGFDEGTGTTVTDASGNGNTGTTSNTTWAATGKYGKALQFNGTNALRHGPQRGLAAALVRDDAGGVGQSLVRHLRLA